MIDNKLRYFSEEKSIKTIELPNFSAIVSFFLRHKGKSQNGFFKKTKHVKFSEKPTFLTP